MKLKCLRCGGCGTVPECGYGVGDPWFDAVCPRCKGDGVDPAGSALNELVNLVNDVDDPPTLKDTRSVVADLVNAIGKENL